MPRARIASAACLLALTAAGCGGSSAGDSHEASGRKQSTPSSSPSPSGDPRDHGLEVTDGITPGKLVDCLTAAGVQADTTDATMMGVDDQHVEVEAPAVDGSDGSGKQGADLYVFADPAAAADNASYITLGGSDDSTSTKNKVAGNVVLTFWYYPAATPSAQEQAVLDCLPS